MLSCFIGFAQNDYLILKDGTKVVGTVKNIHDSDVKFQPLNNEKNKKYKATELNEFYVKTKKEKTTGTYLSKPLPKKSKPVFLFCTVRGPLSFLTFSKSQMFSAAAPAGPGGMPMSFGAGSNKTDYYLLKEHGNLIHIGSDGLFKEAKEKRKQKLAALLEDAPDLVQELEKEVSFNKDVIIRYVKKYNQYKSGTF